MSLIYCYGVIGGNQNFKITGFERGKIYTIEFKDVIAVASKISEENFSQKTIDKNIRNMEWVAENGKIHEDVIDSVMKKTTIIPMKFCTIFKSKKAVKDMLEEKYADFRFNLKNLKDKIEMGVKVYFDSNKLKQKIKEESPQIQKLEKEAEKKKTGAAYFEKKKIDSLLREKLQQRLANDAKNIFNKIKICSKAAEKNELLSKKLTKKDMLLNGVFLINKQGLDEFKDSIAKIKSEYPDLEFQVWGPFPPYNFVK